MADRAAVLDLLTSHNKPFSLQGLQDFLATKGLKKAAITKALELLTASGEVIVKEFGKTKLFIPDQKRLPVLSNEEEHAQRLEHAELKQQIAEQKEVLKAAEAELRDIRSQMTLEQINAEISSLEGKGQELSQKLEQLQGEAPVSDEERMEIEKAFCTTFEHWKARRAIFKNIWGSLSENIERKEAEVFDEMGVDTDEAQGAAYHDMEALYSKVKAQQRSGPAAKKRRA